MDEGEQVWCNIRKNTLRVYIQKLAFTAGRTALLLISVVTLKKLLSHAELWGGERKIVFALSRIMHSTLINLEWNNRVVSKNWNEGV